MWPRAAVSRTDCSASEESHNKQTIPRTTGGVEARDKSTQ